jgi:GNAT superfamily N-acetyltransferase
MAVEYHVAELGDVPKLVGLPREGEAGGDHRMREYLAGEHHPQQALAPRRMWLASDGDTPIGYVAGHLTRRYGCDGELQWIYVAREYRRRGVASRLLGLLVDWFVEQNARRICVDVGNDEARHFYRCHGATELNKHWMIWEDISVAKGASAGDVRTGS